MIRIILFYFFEFDYCYCIIKLKEKILLYFENFRNTSTQNQIIV